jgi:hypothetical protein
LDAVLLPQKVAVIYCPGHQKTDDLISLVNKKADAATKEAAQLIYIQGPILLEDSLLLPERPHYIPSEAQMASSQGYYLDHQGWWITPEDKLLLPQSQQRKVLKNFTSNLPFWSRKHPVLGQKHVCRCKN